MNSGRAGSSTPDHLAAMCEGQVVADGPPADVVAPELVRDLYSAEAVVICPVRRVCA